MTVELQYRLFTVEDLEQMVASGILAEDDRIELIQGQLIEMSPPGIPHAACVDRLNKLFSRQVADDILISIQNPIAANEHSQPEPDVALLAPRNDFYMEARPTPQDVLLLVEVSDSSLTYDQEIKAPLYARVGIREVWLANLQDNWIDCYRQPTEQGYRLRERFFPGDTIHPDALPNVAIDVTNVFDPFATAQGQTSR